ncbi:retrovirus-related pol polyprotein from transposon TNT 1-94 [Tanacetum coccineum]
MKHSEVIKTFLKRITSIFSPPVIIIRTDKQGTEFKNQILKEYFDSVGISHQASSVRTPQQNGVVERRNRTLVEAARTMLCCIFSRAPLFLWLKLLLLQRAIGKTAQNRSIISLVDLNKHHTSPTPPLNRQKTGYLLSTCIRALFIPNNELEYIGKLGAKGDIASSLVIL